MRRRRGAAREDEKMANRRDTGAWSRASIARDRARFEAEMRARERQIEARIGQYDAHVWAWQKHEELVRGFAKIFGERRAREIVARDYVT
jgi:hypothetical protein